MDERVVRVGDVELAVAEAGAGGRPLLLLHGFTGAKEDFGDFLDRFGAEGWHAVAPDHRGHGGSTQPGDESAYSLPRYAADVLGLADTLGFERFSLLGHSMGGMIAQTVAIHAPDRLDALVLMDTSHGPVRLPVERALVDAAAGIARTSGMARLQELLDRREGALTTPADARVRRERPGYAEFGARKFLACSPAMYAAMSVALLDQDDRLEQLRTFPAPALVVVGEQDAPFLDDSARMAEALPAGRLVVLPDAGHSPQFENPEAWWDAVASFLSEIPDRSSA